MPPGSYFFVRWYYLTMGFLFVTCQVVININASVIVVEAPSLAPNCILVSTGKLYKDTTWLCGRWQGGVVVDVPSNLQIWPICKLADQSANHRLPNGTANLKIFLKYCFLRVKHIRCYLTPYFYSNEWFLLKYLVLNDDIRHKL